MENLSAFPSDYRKGMDLRDYFAAAALPAVAAGIRPSDFTGGVEDSGYLRSLAEGSYRVADALLAARANGIKE